MLPVLTHATAVLSAYRRRGEDGLADRAATLHEQAHERPSGKFGKDEAYYLPQSPIPPVLWPVRCERCRFYREGEPGAPATCHIVGREGDRWGGPAIHPRATCGLWMPPAGEPAFAWIRDRLAPRGATADRGTYRSAETSTPSDAPEMAPPGGDGGG